MFDNILSSVRNFFTHEEEKKRIADLEAKVAELMSPGVVEVDKRAKTTLPGQCPDCFAPEGKVHGTHCKKKGTVNK